MDELDVVEEILAVVDPEADGESAKGTEGGATEDDPETGMKFGESI